MTSTNPLHQIRRAITRITLGLFATLATLAILGAPHHTEAPTPQLTATTQPAPTVGCWTEQHQDGSLERMFGDLRLAPTGSTPLDCEAFGEPADTADGTVGTVQEDDPSWDCRTMGNRECGDGATANGEPVPAGDYSDGDQVAGPVGACLTKLGYSAGPVVRAHAEWCTKVDQPATVGVEDGTRVPASFYDATDYNRDGVVDQEPRTQTVTSKVRAEDGTYVPSSFYSATDYNRDGLVDQTGKPIGS